MNGEQIKKTTHHYYRNLSKYNNRIIPGLDVETIHHFRVSYKKLRAFLRMLSLANESNSAIKVSPSLKKAYHIAGEIRNIQLQMLRIKKALKNHPKKTETYLHMLQNKIAGLKPELASLVKNKPVAACRKNTIRLLPQQFTPQHFFQYHQQKWSALRLLISPRHPADNKIHAIRKILKDLYYNVNLFNAVNALVPEKKPATVSAKKIIKLLLDELGNYQDICVSLKLLPTQWIAQAKSQNRQPLLTIKAHWLKDKQTSKRILIKKLRSFFLKPQLTLTGR